MAGMKSPQLIVDSQMLYFGWTPADPGAVDALVPPELRALDNRQVYLNQYIVDKEEQTIDFGKYSLSYLGVDVKGLDVSDSLPGRWWTHYLSSNDAMIPYARDLGIPALAGGTTELDLRDGVLVATTSVNGRPIIRTTADVGPESDEYLRTHIRYVTRVDSKIHGGLYGAIGRCAKDVKIRKLEFLDPSHDVYALRPKDPLDIIWGFYFTSATICYPGGFAPLSHDELARAGQT